MAGIEGLIKAYADFVRLRWPRQLAGSQKVWFAIYQPDQERRLHPRIGEFEIATKKAGHGWAFVDVTDSFARWMSTHEYRDAYFENPDAMDMELESFAAHLTDEIIATLEAPETDENTVVGLVGAGALFGLTRVSTLVERLAPHIRGRLLVFFPGRHEGNNYRLLDARDGWNYLAVAITADSSH